MFHRVIPLSYLSLVRVLQNGTITKEWNWKGGKKKRKNIYVLEDKKKKREDILNERINRINGNKKEENITVDKYGGGSGDVTAIKIVKRNKWIRFTVGR